MARIRTIKPEFFTSESVVACSAWARLFYVSLWCEADRQGRLIWKPKTLKMRYFPADEIDVQSLGDELAAQGMLVFYEVDGEWFAEIPKFTKHQVINNREAESTLPARDAHASSRVVHASSRGSGEGKGKEGKGEARVDDASDVCKVDPPRAKDRRKAVPLPADFAISDDVRRWAEGSGYGDLPRHLEHFVGYVKANGKTYADWDQAFMNAIRADWARLRQPLRANGVIAHPSSATPDEAVLRRISEANGGESVQRLPDGRYRCGVRYYRPSGVEELSI